MRNDEIIIIVKTGCENPDNKQIVLKINSSISYEQLIQGLDIIRDKLDLSKVEGVSWKCYNYIDTLGIDDKKSIHDCGFVSGTILSYGFIDEISWFFDQNNLNSQLFNKRFAKSPDGVKKSMMYNISNRMISQMEISDVDILPPGKPQQPTNSSLLDTVLPTVISFGTLYGFRMFFLPEGANSSYMGLYMFGSVFSTFAIQLYRYYKNRKNLKNGRAAWKSNYESYLARLCKRIEEYQEQDVKYLNNCFPDIPKLIESIESISGSLFSRNANDYDFMMIRLGNSEQVVSLLNIHHSEKDEIELGVTFSVNENGLITIDLAEEDYEENKYRRDIQQYSLGKRILKRSYYWITHTPKRFWGCFLAFFKGYQHENVANEHKMYLNELSEYLAMQKYRYLRPVSVPVKSNDSTENKTSESKPLEDNSKYRILYPPLTLDLKNCGAIGCVGFNENKRLLINHIILDLATNHNPKDLQFVFFFEPVSDIQKQEECISDYRLLPHFNDLFEDIAQFVFDEKSAGLVFSRLESIMNSRIMEQKVQEENEISVSYQQIICIFEHDYDIKKKAFSKYLPVPPASGKTYVNTNGLTFIFSVDYPELLPPYCGIVLSRECDDSPRNSDDGKLSFLGSVRYRNQILDRNTSEFKKVQYFSDDYIFENNYSKNYKKAFSQLSAFYCLHIQERGSVPDSVSLFDLYDAEFKKISSQYSIANIDSLLKNYIKNQWTSKDNRVTKTLSVPIGIGENGIIELDLHEKKHGPHMIVAGTTGSGKSETMLTYLIGLCMHYSPQHLNLMLVDMKGNSFARRLKELPHCVATVDNVSSEEDGISSIYVLKRFLEILKAEIRRRELIMNEYDVDRLDQFIELEDKINAYLSNPNVEVLKQFTNKQIDKIKKLQSSSETPPVLAHLMLVVDEFTELKRFGSENDTDYIGELTSIARVGRTLGLHMILVSQNIENAITDDIRINTNARICLKVATRGASKEMLDGRTDAYYSDMPQGRAYFLVGSGSTYEYFQSGYASELVEKAYETRTVFARLSTCGEHVAEYYDSYRDNSTLKNEVDSKVDSDNQLNVVINNIIELSNNASYRKADYIFQPPLETIIKYSDILKKIENKEDKSSDE